MSNPIIQTDLAEILKEIKTDQKKLLEKTAAIELKLEVSTAKIEGKIDALDVKVDQLEKRISNSELTNRGILTGLVVIILGGAAKLFGLIK
ncbi:MAG: hypothetical protein ACRC2R_09875 [Xenococcaceae cyanobacterium]